MDVAGGADGFVAAAAVVDDGFDTDDALVAAAKKAVADGVTETDDGSAEAVVDGADVDVDGAVEVISFLAAEFATVVSGCIRATRGTGCTEVVVVAVVEAVFDDEAAAVNDIIDALWVTFVATLVTICCPCAL